MPGSLGSLLRTVRVRVGPFVRHVASALHGGPWTKSVRRPPGGESVQVRRADGFSLAGRLYRPDPAESPPTAVPLPGIAMLHGWDPQGQAHGLYVALADALARRGIVVLTVNLRGYPGSDVPSDAACFNVEELTGDAVAAVELLAALPDVDERRVALLGHSYGAGLVIPALVRSPWLAAAIVYGPSIWMEETTTGPEATHREFYHERYWRYMDGAGPVPMEAFLRLSEEIYIPAQVGDLPAAHPPILLLDGADEPDAALSFSAHLFDLLSPPRDYWSIPGTDHFCNTAVIGGLLIEDRAAIEALSGRLVALLDRSPGARSSSSTGF